MKDGRVDVKGAVDGVVVEVVEMENDGGKRGE